MHTTKRRLALSALVGLVTAATLGAADPAEAQRRREAKADTRQEELAPTRPAGPPLMAVVALDEQRVTIYDADGKIMRAPVSSGQRGYETPAGIYSIIQKNREHYSNLYDDAAMPFMQRITWSGIALHAGALPGYPASHGCIRLPHQFAENLFDLTRMGMRVVVVRSDMSPVEITHPSLFQPAPAKPQVAALVTPVAERPAGTEAQSMRLGAAPPAPSAAMVWRAIAAEKAAAFEAATRKGEDARRAAVRARADAARHVKALRMAEGARRRAEEHLADVERTLAAASGPAEKERAEDMKAKALERLSGAQAHLAAAKAEGQPKIDAVAEAYEQAKQAEAARVAALIEARVAEKKLAPISVFISRKTQQIHIRRSFEPIYEGPVTIRDPDDPIGTTIFTALRYGADGADVRWSALAMYADAAKPEAAATKPAPRGRGAPARRAEPVATDAAAARAALDRITIPQEALDRITEVVSPGSSLIISDEALSRETSKGTDFIVVMSGEPQGGIKIRSRNPYSSYDRGYRRSPYYSRNPYAWW